MLHATVHPAAFSLSTDFVQNIIEWRINFRNFNAFGPKVANIKRASAIYSALSQTLLQ